MIPPLSGQDKPGPIFVHRSKSRKKWGAGIAKWQEGNLP